MSSDNNNFINNTKASLAEIAKEYEKNGIGTTENNMYNLVNRFVSKEFEFSQEHFKIGNNYFFSANNFSTTISDIKKEIKKLCIEKLLSNHDIKISDAYKEEPTNALKFITRPSNILSTEESCFNFLPGLPPHLLNDVDAWKNYLGSIDIIEYDEESLYAHAQRNASGKHLDRIKKFINLYTLEVEKFLTWISDKIYISHNDFLHWSRLKRNENKDNKYISPLPYNTFWGDPWSDYLKTIFSANQFLSLKDFFFVFEPALWELLSKLRKRYNLSQNYSYPHMFLPLEIESRILALCMEPIRDDTLHIYKHVWQTAIKNLANLIRNKMIKVVGTIELKEKPIESLIFANLIESSQIDFCKSSIPSQNIYGIKIYILKPEMSSNMKHIAQKMTDAELWKIFIADILGGKFEENNKNYSLQAVQAWKKLSDKEKSDLKFFKDKHNQEPIKQNITTTVESRCVLHKSSINTRIVKPFLEELFQNHGS